MLKKVTDTIYYVGANDHDVDLFEGQYVVPNGMAYNSYVIVDEKVAVMDTIDASKTEEWLKNIEKVLDSRLPDYLVVQHMEPDHAASIETFVNKYPAVTVVANKKTFAMIGAARAEGRKSDRKTLSELIVTWVLTYPVCMVLSYVLCAAVSKFLG